MNPIRVVESQRKNKTPVREHSFTWSKYDITNLSGTSTTSEVMHKISYENIMKAITKDLYPSQGLDHDKDGDKDDYEVDFYITPEGINRIPFSYLNKCNIIYTKVLSSNFNQSHPSNRTLTTFTINDATPNNSPSRTRSHDIYDLRKAFKEHKLNWSKYNITGIKNNTEISHIRENFDYSSIMKNAYNEHNRHNSVDYTIVSTNITRIPFSTSDHCNIAVSTTKDYDALHYPSISNRSSSFSLLTSSTTTEGTPTNSPYHDDFIDED